MDSTLTVAEQERLLKLARAARLKTASPEPAAIARVDRGGRLPLSFAQQRMWLVEQMGDTAGAYHIRKRVALKGALDRTALDRALAHLVARHEALRTTVVQVDDEPEQRIASVEESAFRLEERDLIGTPAGPDFDASLRRVMEEDARERFDLARGPLIRGRLVRVAADEHLLLLTMHHIVSDGWSMGVLANELSALYDAFRRAQPNPLPPLEIQYADYAAWQRRSTPKHVLQEQAAFWTRTLTGAPDLLTLPTDDKRPDVQDYVGGAVGVDLDETLTSGVKALSRRHGTTLFMTLLAAWSVVLSRLAGQDDVVIGTPVANRGRREIEGLIGLFVNTLALRIDLSGAPTVAELLQRVKARAVDAQHHQDVPFEQVVEALQPVRSLSHGPLFQVTFAWHNTPPTLALEGLEVRDVGLGSQVAAKSDLLLALGERRGRIKGLVTYPIALFRRETVARYMEYFRRALESMVSDDGQTIDRLPLLPDAERARVVAEWNATDAEWPREQYVHELFAAQVRERPDAVAAACGAASVTYAVLDDAATALAAALRARGAGPDRCVALCLGPSIAWLVGALAVMKAGAAYVPLDPSYPRERLQFMLDDSQPVAVLASAGSAPAWLAETRVPVIALDEAARWDPSPQPSPRTRGEGAAPLSASRGEGGVRGISPEHLAYVIYTSGSTGRPKGVMVTHAGLTHYVTWARATYAGAAPIRAALHSSVAFDLTVTSIFVPLVAGGAVEIYPEPADGSPAIVQVIEDDRVDLVKLTPSHLRLIAGAPWAGRRLQHLIVGGEDLKTALARTIHDASNGQVAIDNEYGPTEATVGCVLHRFDPRDTADSVSIGRPIANFHGYVVDAAGAPVPIGVVGELLIGGVGLGRGYVGRPGLTAERFIADGVSGAAGGRVYRTGDLARWRADGTIEFLGRRDHQVKVRGHRIELGEIEARLGEHPAVRDAIVIAREDAPDEVRLVAYWVGTDTAAETLRQYLSERLPAAMVPAAFVHLEALPLTPNAKVDRAALPAPEAAPARDADAFEAPIGETEQTVAEVWAEVLRVPRVGRQDDFFALGGHSLLALKLIQQLRKRDLHVTIQTVFLNSRLHELAAAVGSDSRATVPAAAPALASAPAGIPAGTTAIAPAMLPLVELDQDEIDRVTAAVTGGAANVQDIYPLAPLQEGILFHHLTAKEGDPYLLMFLLEFETRARMDAYIAALQAVIDRHDILRTSVMWEGLREPVQVVWRQARFEVIEVALDAADGDIGSQLRQRFSPRRHRLDIRRAPLIRIYVAHDARTDRWMMLRQQHHLIADHVAADVLQHEVTAHLDGRARELPPPLPFRDYVMQTRSRGSQAEQEAFFKGLLGDVAEPTAPFGLLNVLGDGIGIDESLLDVDLDLAMRLRARARALGVSPASVCHVAWAQVLARVSARRDVVFGTVLFGRAQGGEGTDRILGLFINTLPVRIDVGSIGAEAAVRQTQALLAELMRHEQASLALAQRCSRVEPPAPLFTSLLNYRYSARAARPDAPARAASPGIRVMGGEERSNYPLTMAVDDLGERLRLRAKVESGVEAARVCALMHQALDALVTALDTTPDRPLERIDVLPAAERAQVVRNWNATARHYPDTACVHEHFEAQVERHPNAVAVVHDGRTMTYHELNAHANRLAHHLRDRGVGPDSRVGICADRGLDQVIGLLAVLKAGGAYVPLDPSYPIDRLRYMLSDSAAVVLLTQRGLAGMWTGIDIPVIELDAAASAWADRPAIDLEVRGLSPDNLLYVIYTSGSTGRPKGVLNPHRAVVNRLTWMQERHGLRADEAVLQNSSFSFDASVFELFWPLTIGARVVLARQDSYKDPASLLATIRDEGVTTAYFVCSMLQYFLELDGVERCSSLRRLLCGGEALSATLARRVGERLPGARLWNLYGPSESAVSVTTPVDTSANEAARVAIGRPVTNVRVYIVDRDGQPMPVGVVGELYVGGVQLARGYIDRPAATAERFIADWLTGEPGARLYATGDLGKWRPDGTIDFLGRNDGQIKVRGFRIEPEEIEARLLEQPGISEAVVVAREDTPGDQRLVAYWLGTNGANGAGGADVAAMRSRLAETLPEYMVPSAYVQLEAWPRTPNGKVDRRALPAPDGDVYTTRGYEAPIGDTEQVLAEIWAELLGVPRVGRHDHFFELGGHSLLAIRLMERMRRRGLQTEVRTLFLTPTLAELAAGTQKTSSTDLPPELITSMTPGVTGDNSSHTEWRI